VFVESENRIPTIVVFSGSPANWNWYADDCPGKARWIFYTEEPKNFIERVIQRPRLSRIFGAFRCVQAARRQSASAVAALSQFHTFWAACAMCLLRVRKPLLSFSFHFSKLPTGLRLRLSKWAFSRVERFGVHSTPERERYAQHFGIPVERFDLTLWGVRPSSVETEEAPSPLDREYICAMGKDGRDYRTLTEAMKQMPELTLLLVAQPYNLVGCEIPENVKVCCDIPRAEALNILKHSQFMALPLEKDDTSCGHITLVSAMFCHKAIVATGSIGIADYFPPDYAAPRVAAGDVDGWVRTLRAMARDPQGLERCATTAEQYGRLYCSHDAAYRSTMAVFRRAGLKIDPEESEADRGETANQTSGKFQAERPSLSAARP
jgi:hypothetical protein